MNNDDIHGLSGAYAVDAVDDVERARFEAHMAGCSECQAEVASLRAAASELTSTTITTPPTSLRESVLRDISSVRPLPPRVTSEGEQATAPVGSAERSEPTAPTAPSEPTAPTAPSELIAPTAATAATIPSTAPTSPTSATAPTDLESKRAERAGRAPLRQWLAGAAAAAVLATGGLVWHPWTSDTNTLQLTATQQVLQAKDAQHFEKKVGDATTTIVRSPSLKKAVIVTANMPAAPEGKVYELWLQQGTTMVRAGLMPTGPANTVLLDGDATSAQAVGITLEPAGGSDTPTLPPVALISFA
jgi:anti-sigma factor RsiW